MRFVSADDIDNLLSFPILIGALEESFCSEIVVPVRAHHSISRSGASDATLLLMPAWTAARGGYLGTKLVSVFPDNRGMAKPSIVGLYVLMDGDTGEPLCVMDGPRLTAWRTAAASALAARYLARQDASRLVMVGAGTLAPFLIKAHANVRPISQVLVWNRHKEGAEKIAAELSNESFQIAATDDLEGAVRGADIVTCATMSPTSVIKGAWLKPGCHLDLVGAYRPTMRESDDAAVKRARLYCDTRAGALQEGGDLADPLTRGIIQSSDIIGDLFELARQTVPGRRGADEITLFKSVGTAIEDLSAAMLVWQHLTR